MVANAHYKSFCDLFGKENIEVISIKTRNNEEKKAKYIYIEGYRKKIDRLFNLIEGYPAFYSKSIDNFILEKVKTNKYDIIYFDNSYFGNIIKKIKKYNPSIPVIVFFHGIKGNSGRQIIKKNLLKPQIVLANINNMRQEKKATKYADKCIVLNKREENELEKYYNKGADLLLPVYYKDTAKIENIKNNISEFRILFLGGNFWPNILGIKWFTKNVMPYVDKKAKLYIVGRGMEKLKKEKEFINVKNVEVIGGTDDLDYWYNSSDIVVGPIFNGDGMKTKTAEALMYGKLYIGTKEALCGYIGLEELCCNTDKEFIEKINVFIKMGVKKFDPEIRKLYDENYSVEAANKKIEKLINEMEIDNEK